MLPSQVPHCLFLGIWLSLVELTFWFTITVTWARLTLSFFSFIPYTVTPLIHFKGKQILFLCNASRGRILRCVVGGCSVALVAWVSSLVSAVTVTGWLNKPEKGRFPVQQANHLRSWHQWRPLRYQGDTIAFCDISQNMAPGVDCFPHHR